MKKKKVIASTVALLLAATTVIGCTKSDNGGNKASEAPSSAAPSKATESASTGGKYPLINYDSMFPVTKEPIELEVLYVYDSINSGNFEDLWFNQYMDKFSNVKIKPRLIASEAWPEQKAIMLASNNLPDIFFVPFNNSEMVTYAMNDKLMIPLNEYLNDKELTPNINKVFETNSDLKAASVLPDGNIYGLGYYLTDETASGFRAQWIMEFLKKANVDPKSIVTLDDLYDTLVALRDSDFNGNGKQDEIPWGYYSDNNPIPAWSNLLGYVLNAHGFVTGDGAVAVNTRDNTAGYAPLTEQYKSTIEYLKKLYSEKLLDQDTFTQTESDFQAKGKSGLIPFTTYFNSYAVVPDNIVAEHTAANYDGSVLYSSTPVVDQAGNTPVTNGDYMLGLNQISISKSSKYPEVAIRWLDAMFDPVNSLYYRSGPEHQSELDWGGTGWIYDTEKTDINMLATVQKKGMDNGYLYLLKYNSYLSSVAFVGTDDKAGLKILHPDAYTKQANNWLTPYVTNINPYEVTGFPSVYYTGDEQEFNERYVPELHKYVYSMTAKFITGAESMDKYDSFVEGMKKLKASEYNELLHNKFEEYKKSK